jgi:drug/metabolite transporter (DMT)-like permease
MASPDQHETTPPADPADHSDPTGPGHSGRTIGLFAVVLAVLCFAISFALIKWAATPGSVLAWWRLVGSTLVWWALLVFLHVRAGRPFPPRRTWRLVFPAALLFGLYISILFTAVTKTSVAHSEFINALAPLLTLPIGFMFFHERPNWSALRWGVLSLAGLVFVLFSGPDQGAATLEGDLLVVLVVGIWAAYMSMSKWARQRGVDTIDFMAIVMPVALVTATPVALSFAGGDIWPLSDRAWFTVITLSLLTGSIAHGLLFFAHRNVPIGTISTIQVSQPAISVFWAWVIVGEQITFIQAPGMILVIVGLALVLWFSQKDVSTRAI